MPLLPLVSEFDPYVGSELFETPSMLRFTPLG